MDKIFFDPNLYKNINIYDELQIAIIDTIFVYMVPPNAKSNISKIKSDGIRFLPDDGIHTLCFSSSDYLEATKVTKNDKSYYQIKAIIATEEKIDSIKTIHRLLQIRPYKYINKSFVSIINNYIIKKLNMMKCGGVIDDIVPEPIDGIYFVPGENANNFMLARKKLDENENQSYSIVYFGDKCKKNIDTLLYGDRNRVNVANITIIDKNINGRKTNKMPITTIKNSQKTCANEVIKLYNNRMKKNISVLISGVPGVGKTTIAFIVAQIMKEENGVDPCLLKGFNVFSDMIQFHPVIGHYNPTSQCPIVLLLDEFDIAMKKSCENNNKNLLAIAANKTNMNNFLDDINDEPYLITIATTNMSINDVVNNYGVYVRKGRFDMHVEIINDNELKFFDPPNF